MTDLAAGTAPAPVAAASAPRLDRHFWLAVLIAALVLVTRGLLITSAHSPTMDEQTTHLRVGLSTLTGNPSGLVRAFGNVAPLGPAVVAAPMYVMGCRPAEPMNPATMTPRKLASEDPTSVTGSATPELMRRLRAARRDVLFGHQFAPDTIRLWTSAWLSLLFVPAAGLIFHWCRRLYGLHGGWFALMLVLVEPTFAAHIPLATTDAVALIGLLFACYFVWRVMEEPARRPLLVAASFFTAAALLLKLTTVILPVFIVVIAILFAVKFDRRAAVPRDAVRKRLNLVLAGGLLTCGFVWMLTGFDFTNVGPELPSPSKRGGFSLYGDILYPALQHRWPAGEFIRVLIGGVEDNDQRRWAYLLGEAKRGGWWYYFPVVGFYKVPLGYFLIFVVAVITLFRSRLRFAELSLLLPMVAWTFMLMFVANINTGFRHFLPAYVFMLMLAARAIPAVGSAVRGVLWAAVAVSLGHTLTYHPDYLSYFNRPVEKPWWVCNDSNVDWGQGLKQVGQWLDEHPTDRPVYIRYDWDQVWVDYYLAGRVRKLQWLQEPPTSGLLIICPVWEAGYWDPTDAYRFLRPEKPSDVIGHAMPVYDLDAIHAKRGTASP